MIYLILMGSTGAGKTTLGKILKSLLAQKEYFVKHVEININHGFSYILTLFLVRLLSYRYVSNYYLSLRFRNPRFFCKYFQLMMLLDILYAPIKILTGILSFELFCKIFRKKGVIIIDEYYFTAIIEYLYYSVNLCQCLPWNAKTFYKVMFHLASATLKNIKRKVKILHLHTSENNSVKALRLRDKTNIIDVKHIRYKSIGIKTIIDVIKHYFCGIEIIKYRILCFPRDIVDIAKNLYIIIRNIN